MGHLDQMDSIWMTTTQSAYPKIVNRIILCSVLLWLWYIHWSIYGNFSIIFDKVAWLALEQSLYMNVMYSYLHTYMIVNVYIHTYAHIFKYQICSGVTENMWCSHLSILVTSPWWRILVSSKAVLFWQPDGSVPLHFSSIMGMSLSSNLHLLQRYT